MIVFVYVNTSKQAATPTTSLWRGHRGQPAAVRRSGPGDRHTNGPAGQI